MNRELPNVQATFGKDRGTSYQAPQSTEFSRQGYWSWLLFPSPGDLPDPGIEHGSPALQAGSLPSEPLGKQQKDS